MNNMTRSIHRIAPAVLIALLVLGCGQSDTKQADKEQAAASRTAVAPAPKAAGTGEFNNAAALLLDGTMPADQTAFDSEQCVHWVDPAVSFVIDLGEVRRVTGVTLQVDNNDDYVLETSRDGVAYAAFATIPATAGANEWGLETLSTLPEHPGAVPNLAVAPTEARYLRLRGSEGDSAYGVSEVRVASESLAPSGTAAAAAPSAGSGSAPPATGAGAAATAAVPAAVKPSELVGFTEQEARDVTLEQAFDAVDADHDGKLTKAEYAAIWKDKSGVDDNFAYFDHDRSGCIEKQEYLSFPDRLRDGK